MEYGDRLFWGERTEDAGDIYMCIDLKSFFASVECVERGLDPMMTDLVVADSERSRNTICLAVTPHMKSLGVSNRCRICDIPSNIAYITAPPRMQKYLDYSADIYGIYLDFVSSEDVHIYSIDEVFIYATPYLKLYKMTPREFAFAIMKKIYKKTGIRSSCGIGTNMYLCKIALDIMAKHTLDFVGELDEKKYREQLWDHLPLTDFWRIGRGTAARLSKYGINTMRDIAHTDQELLYSWFGVDAELLIDHSWGRESVRMSDIKAYRSKSRSISSSQVLMRDYGYADARVVLCEMCDSLILDLVREAKVCSSVSVGVGYSDNFGSDVGGMSKTFDKATSSKLQIMETVLSLYDRICERSAAVRRLCLTFGGICEDDGIQYSFFDDIEAIEQEIAVQNTVIDIKKKYGKNSILRGISYTEAATARERNDMIGGHKSGKKTAASYVKS